MAKVVYRALGKPLFKREYHVKVISRYLQINNFFHRNRNLFAESVLRYKHKARGKNAF